jgi:hypothetical protein
MTETLFTCMTLAEALTKEADAVRKTEDDMMSYVECYNGLERIHHDLYTHAELDDLSETLEANGTCDISMDLVRIMNICLDGFGKSDVANTLRLPISNKIMQLVHFLHYLHNMS